jgi:hypothetical protein
MLNSHVINYQVLYLISNKNKTWTIRNKNIDRKMKYMSIPVLTPLCT